MDTIVPGIYYWSDTNSSRELIYVIVRAVSDALAAPAGSRAYRPRCSQTKQSRVFVRRNFLGALASHVLAPPYPA
jgi:hypothetical protein